ncbi:chloride channel protein [Actinoplanes sp. NPDC051861]|uniref:chloride channel protein n=1 Tax=Actinoplanes sp. NPDC051861 TaxID=3155170 RepID=UPI0034213A62
MGQARGAEPNQADRAGTYAITDPWALIRSRRYWLLLLLSAVLGVVVSAACWAFLEFTHWLQVWLYRELPTSVGFSSPPWWWPLPVLAVAGFVIASAVVWLPGNGGHEPSEGLRIAAPTTAADMPGVVLAAVATVGLGLVLGPEAPLIALGTGLTMFLIGLPRRQLPDQAKLILTASAGFAALATIFGSPVVGAVIIIEAAAIGGSTLPVILLPGLLAAGTGSLMFVGIGSLTGLSTNAFALPAITLPPYPTPQLTDFLWSVPLALLAAVVVFLVIRLAELVRTLVARHRLLLTPVAALIVGLGAIAFHEVSGQPAEAVLFSGQEAITPLLEQAGTVSVGTLALLLLCKAVAWALSLGSARGGPTFPAIFLGLVGGLLAGHLATTAQTAMIGALVGASVVAVLRLPLSSIVIALLLTRAGAGAAPLIILSVVVAYIATLLLTARRAASAPRPSSETG